MRSRQPFDLEYALIKFRTAVAAFRVRQKFEQLRQKAGYDPNQPRVPAGNPDGGQWTDGGASSERGASRFPGSVRPKPGEQVAAARRTVVDRTGLQPWRSYTEQRRLDGTLATRTVENRDGSRIETSFPRGGDDHDNHNIVTLPDGAKFTFDNDGNDQRIFDGKGRLISQTVWTSNGPEPQAIAQAANLRVVPTRQLMRAGRELYNSLGELGEALGAIFAFRAWDRQGRSAEKELLFSGALARDEVARACPALPMVQSLTDEAARLAGSPSVYPSPAVYGTAVHMRLRDLVRASGNPTLRAEVSFMKSIAEAPGVPGSIRIDVIEILENGTVCIYDIKTGKRGLSRARIDEMTSRLLASDISPTAVIVIEIRPYE